jgi:hypothetical protein
MTNATALLPLPLVFNGSLRVETRPERLTSEAGGLIQREIIERTGIMPWLTERLQDPREPTLITHPLGELICTACILRGQGWRDQDDADVLRNDPVLRLAVSSRKGIAPLVQRPPREDGQPLSHNPAVPDGLASQPTLSRLDRTLSCAHNRGVLREALVELASRRVRASRPGHHRMRYVTIDVDSLPIEVHGHQPAAEYNGYYHATVYHPLVASIAETGDLLDVHLRHGRAWTGEGALEFVVGVLDRVETSLCQVASVRIDAGLPEEGLMWHLETRGTPYVARIKNNSVLDRMAEPLLRRPPGRRPAEPRTWFHEMTYQAESWSRPRRVVLVVLEQEDELLLRHFWLITNWSADQMPAEDLLDLYRRRGVAENHQGEWKDVFDPALSSSPRPKSVYGDEVPARRYPSGDSFAINEVRLLLDALAYNILHVGRMLLQAATGEGWSLRRFRERLLRVAARVLVHGRRALVVVAQAASELWSSLWAGLARFRFTVT